MTETQEFIDTVIMPEIDMMISQINRDPLPWHQSDEVIEKLTALKKYIKNEWKYTRRPQK